MCRILFIFILTISTLFSLTNKELAQKSDEVMSGFIDSVSIMNMKLINAKGQEKTRLMKMKVLEGEEADKSLMEFSTPADVKGTKFLNYEHINKDDDQWLYLPALKRVKRIASKNKSGAFMGSEFSYEDLSAFNVKKYKYQGDATLGNLDGKDVYIGESVPVSKYSGYTKLKTYIDKDSFLIQKIEYFDRKKKLLKTAYFSDYKKFGNINRIGKITMKNIQNDKTTILIWTKEEIKTGLNDKDFHKRHLKKMRILLTLISLSLALMADIEFSGHIDLDSQAYITRQDSKHPNSFTAKQTLELNYTEDALKVFAKVYAEQAYYDFLKEKDNTGRTFARIDELYLKYDFEDDSFQAGKNIKFWGALELRNIVDIFNPNELRDDLLKTNKLGVWNTSYSHYTDSGELSIIIKLEEPNQKMAKFPYVYYLFPEIINYDDSLKTSRSEHRPSVYLTYSGSTDSEYPIDYAFIYENGYNSQRYFSTLINQPTSYIQNAYLVNKFMTYNTLVIGSTLIKLEALYAVVEDREPISDYSHIAFGVEHSLEDFYNGSTLGLIAEYYNYTTYEDGKYNDLQLFETMQDDVFLGARYVLNNEDDSSIVGGVIHDFEYDEQTYYVEFESRIGEDYKLEIDYYYIEPSKKASTAYALLGRHQRIGVNVAYYF